MKIKRDILCVLFLLAFAFLTLTARADFSIASSNLATNSVCPSSTIVAEDIVTSAESGSFALSVTGTASAFTTTVPNGFWLDAGQSQAVYMYITPSSRIAPGIYSLELTITKGNSIKTIRHVINVENCHKTILEVTPAAQSICACEQNSIFLKLINRGNYVENYEIIAEGPASSWINLSSYSITLTPNSTTELTAYILPSCNAVGSYEINFVAKAKSEYARANAKASVSVLSCYDYSLNTEKTLYSMCEGEKLSVPVRIKNSGTRDNNYRVNINAPEWVSVDSNQVFVGKDSEAGFNIMANPPYGTNESADVDVEVMNEFGKVLKKHSIEIDVEKCYDVSLSVEKEKDKICNALTNTYSLFVRNNGKFLNTYDIVLEAPEWVTISESRLTLNASREKLLTLDVHPPYNAVARNYTVDVKAVDAISKVEAKDEFIIETISVEDCYKPAINTETETINVVRDNTATALFIIENKGTKDANYSIEISGTATKFSQINPGTITLQASKAQTVYLYIAPQIDLQPDNYSLTVTARLKDTTIIASKTIKINVLEKRLEEEEGAVQPEEITPVEKELSPLMKFVRWLADIFRVKAPLNATQPQLNITAPENITNVTQPPANITNIIQLPENITNVTQPAENVSNVTAPATPEENITQPEGNVTTPIENITNETQPSENITNIIQPTENITNETQPPENITNVTTPEENITIQTGNSAPVLAKPIPDINLNYGQNQTIDLSQYFSDADNDSLTYSTVKPLNISVTIADNILTMEPQQPFDGTREITFYASDNKEITKSNVVKINVKAVAVPPTPQPISTAEFISKYKGWIVTAIIIVIIIIILSSGLGKKIISFFEEETETK